MAKNKNNQTIWGTRIKKKTSTLFQKVGSSVDIDKRLYKEDIAGSIAHVEMLLKQKIISLIGSRIPRYCGEAALISRPPPASQPASNRLGAALTAHF